MNSVCWLNACGGAVHAAERGAKLKLIRNSGTPLSCHALIMHLPGGEFSLQDTSTSAAQAQHRHGTGRVYVTAHDAVHMLLKYFCHLTCRMLRHTLPCMGCLKITCVRIAGLHEQTGT